MYSDKQLQQLKAEKSADSDRLRALSVYTFPFLVSTLRDLDLLKASKCVNTFADYIWLGHLSHDFQANNFLKSYDSLLSSSGLIFIFLFFIFLTSF